MDLPPPPPLFRYHHHHLRYENVLRPPDFIPPPYSHPLPPPPPPPHPPPPHILLPPPPPHPPAMRHIEHPPLHPRFAFSPPRRPIVERSHLYELDLPPKPYFDGTLLPPPPPPAPRENIPLRFIHDYPDRSPIFRDEILRRDFVDNHIHELPENWDRDFRLGARELHTRVPDLDIGDNDRYRDSFYQSRELYKMRDDRERWDSGISDLGHDLYSRRDFDERRWDSVMDDRGCEVYSERDYDERIWDNGINDRRCELYYEGDDNERRWISSRSDGVLSRLGNRQPEFVENDLSLGRFSGRLGMGASKGPKGEFNRSNKKRRLQKKDTLHRIQSGKDCSRQGGGCKRQQYSKGSSRGSLKGKQKGVERSQTRIEDKREREQSPLELAISFKSNALVAKAILAPSHPVVKSDVKSAVSADERLVHNMSGSSSAKPSNAWLLDRQSDSQKTSKDLLDKAAVSGSGSVTASGANDLGESALNNAHLKVMNIQGPTMVRSPLSKLKKKKRARKQLWCKANRKMEKSSDDIRNAKDCINRASAVSQLNSDTTLSNGNFSSAFIGADPGSLPSLGGAVSEKADISRDSCRNIVPKLKRKRSGLTKTSASSCVADNVITECSGHAERSVTTTEHTDHLLHLRAGEFACHAHEMFLANQHMNSVDKFVHDRVSVLDAEKGAIESIDEHPVCGGLILESSFTKGPSAVTFSIENHGTAGSSRPQETRIPEVHEDKYFSEKHELISSPKSDCAVTKTPEDVAISDAASKDANSKDFFLDQVNAAQVGIDAEEFKSLEGGAVADCSNVGLGISNSSCFLSADCKAIIPKFDVSSPVVFETNLSHNINSVEGSPEVITNGETCLSTDCSSKIIRKRKARGAHVGTVRSIKGEIARRLTDGLVPSPDVDFLGEKDSCKEDGSLKEGPSGVEDSIQEVDFGTNDSSSGYRKKRKFASPRSSLSSLSEDDTIADGLTTNSPILDLPSTRLAEWGAEEREDTSSASPAINQCVTADVEDRNGVDVSNSDDELLASGFDVRSCMSSPEELLACSESSFIGKSEASACLPENEMICGSDNLSNEKPVPADPSICCLGKSLKAAVNNSQTIADIPPSKLEHTSQVFKELNPAFGKLTWSKNQLTSAVPKVLHGQNPLNFSNSRKLYPIHATKSRTWRRTGNSSVAVAEPKLQPSPVPQSHGTKVARTTQSSYIRKGNSLVRNPSLSGVASPGIHGSSFSVYRLTPCTDTMKSNQVTDHKTHEADAPTLTRIEQLKTSEMTKAPTLNHSGKSLSCTASNLGKSLPVGNPPTDSCPRKTLDAMEERIKSSPGPDCQNDSVVNSDSQSTLEEGNSEKKIMYVKRRSNQLVATSNSDDTSVLGVDKSQASLSDGYYKSRQNQLVRASSKNHVKSGDANVNARTLVFHSILPKTSTRRQSGIAKSCRNSKFSFVWKLHDAQSSEKDKNSLGPQKVWPHLFSSKRAACWRRLVLGTKLNNSSFSTISQKLLLSRKRGAIYTRSTHGYSLRMSKVLSVGGSSLKWSKSIERNSKKANEDATRAAAAAEKRKIEGKSAAQIASKSRNHVPRKLVLSVKLRPGERIFRIGSERYKMDPTRRTLRRITEEEPSASVAVQSEKNVKRSYIPRRLIIGNEEYVRVGNGNQLVRDPKKRTRVLASEKVRWSLRTARLRLARKRKYCQFFTRFGKCNKDDGKCPYIHDPSKIVVCTKFLTGSCSNPDCKLTHKVIPERMQDCSYFLKGSCSNENCPYRHGNVDPDSTVCESFLRGYCADGNKCRKKHTYVCPAFEATGVCPQASTCKLHHPKKKLEKKPASEQKIVRGRYFDGGLIAVADCSEATAEKLSAKGKVDTVCHEGKFPDYISLDVSDDEMDHTVDSKQVAGTSCRMDREQNLVS